MKSLCVWIAALIWGAAQLTPGASITGTIRSLDGKPAANVRVVAMAVPNAQGIADAAVFESITQTDSDGRYRLDNVSPGRYFIATGPVGYLTFHPGTTMQSAATVIAVTRDTPLFSGVDFTTAQIPTALQGGVPPQAFSLGGAICCRLRGRLLMDDGSPTPHFPIRMRVFDRRADNSANLNADFQLQYFTLTIPIKTTAEIAIEGLPPGYVLKSVAYGGKNTGLTTFQVDGQSTGTLDLFLTYEPISTLKKVTARGKVVNPPSELKVTSIRFASTIANGPVLVAALRPDGSFEYPDIPVGAYRTGVIDPSGGASTSPNIVVIRDDASGLTIDLHNNPFPEFDGVRPERTAFTNGQSSEITGVITQRLTPIGATGSVYFRMDVKDTAGIVTPWAVFAERDWVPKIVVGETITVPGVLSTDRTHRISAPPF